MKYDDGLRERPDVLLQGYIVGLGGGEVDPPLVELVLDDLAGRERTDAPVFFPKGLEPDRDDLPADARHGATASHPSPGQHQLPRLRDVVGPAVAR